MTTSRCPLPDRRETTRQKLVIRTADGPWNLYVDVGQYDDGTPGELFMVVEKTGASMRALLDEVARGASSELQHGVSIRVLVERWRATKFEPCGPVTGHPAVKFCSSPLDAVAQYLQAEYVKGD